MDKKNSGWEKILAILYTVHLIFYGILFIYVIDRDTLINGWVEITMILITYFGIVFLSVAITCLGIDLWRSRD